MIILKIAYYCGSITPDMSIKIPAQKGKDTRKRAPARVSTEEDKPVVLNLTLTALIFKRLSAMKKSKGALNETELIRVGISNMLDTNGF